MVLLLQGVKLCKWGLSSTKCSGWISCYRCFYGVFGCAICETVIDSTKGWLLMQLLWNHKLSWALNFVCFTQKVLLAFIWIMWVLNIILYTCKSYLK